ncbi:MAG: ROK family protein [Anaerolineae bacterium]|nr:ROK family protein [Anaerolineae bacterium]
MADVIIGVDIGGTSVVAAVVAAADGRVLSRDTMPTEAQRGPEDGMRRIGDLIARVAAQAGLPVDHALGIGIGCTGPIDSVRGRIQNPYTLPTWDDMPVVDALVERFGRPALLLHDCAVAALGEQWVGAGQGARHLLYITVGTGIGGGIIVGGRLYRGVGLLAGEVGHQVIDLNGPACYCGARGCWEMLAAAPALSKLAAGRAEPDGLMLRLAGGDREKITPRIVSEAAAQGDAVAKALWEQEARYLGIGVANLMNVLAPEVVVMGGGIMQGWESLAPVFLETIRARGAMVPFDQIRVVPAGLGLNAGVIGAARGLAAHLRGEL